MWKNKRWLSGLLAVAASLLLTGCGEGYYGESYYESSHVSVWEDDGDRQTGQEDAGQSQAGREEGESRFGHEDAGQSASTGRTGDAERGPVQDEDDVAGNGGQSPEENKTASGETWEGSSEETESFWIERKPSGENQNDPAGPGAHLDEYGSYTSAEDVALYLYTYEELPDNFITKKEARDLGWEGGSLEPYAPGMCIGGDYFGNYEGNLPEEEGREYHECDIDTMGSRSRGAKRIVYSNDGLIYYTEDHYETFTLLYGEE